MTRCVWDVLPAHPCEAATLAQCCGISPLVAQLLLNRGVNEPSDVRRFLAPMLERLDDPLKLPGMAQAVSRVARAVASNEPILVFGDSDVDGITASAILHEALTSRGGKVFVRLSNRLADGYGFPKSLIARMARFGIRLLILVDCGTNQPEEIRQLVERGIDTIVLDHHVLSARVAVPLALVNPRRSAEAEAVCSSAGLAFKLVQALGGGREESERLLDLAALGTLADYAPLRGDNRILVSAGLERIVTTGRPGLRQLCDAVGVTRAVPEQILRRLVPRLNAAGRLGTPKPVWQLLVEPDAQAASRLAGLLGAHHATTKALHRRLVMEAHEQASRIHFKDQYVVVIARRGWHPGLMGPIAAQLAERFNRPSIALALDEHLAVGSGRSTSGFDLFEALRACEELLLRYGGHPQACGLTIDLKQLDRFRDRINRHAEGACLRKSMRPTLQIDTPVTLSDLAGHERSSWEALKPFGPSNPQPLLLVPHVSVERDVGGTRWLADGAVRIKTRERMPELSPQRRYDVVASPQVVDGTLALSLRDYRESSIGDVTVVGARPLEAAALS